MLSTTRIHMHIYTLFCYPATPPTEIYTLSLHDALPISLTKSRKAGSTHACISASFQYFPSRPDRKADRKSTRLNSSHVAISYAVFCLKKKNLHHHLTPPAFLQR